MDYRELHLATHRAIAEWLAARGFLKISAEAAVAEGITSVFFPHGLGHLIGLQVHDVSGLQASEAGGEIPRPEGHPYLRLTRVLEPGMAITIEPGLYFIDQLLEALAAGPQRDAVDWSRIDALRPYGGIRIEDDVLVTDEGHRNLTREAYAELA